MGDEENSRYGLNRNRWKRVYSYSSRLKPKVVSVLDNVENSYFNVDLQKNYKHIDYHEIKKVIIRGRNVDYEEGLIYFNNTDIASASFSITFEAEPFVVYTLEDVNDVSVNIFGLTLPTTTQCIAAASAPFSGTVRYRATQVKSGYSFPLLFNSITSGSFWVYAGQVAVENTSSFSASFSINAGGLEARATAYDVNENSGSDVSITKTSLTVSEYNADISAPLNNTIHFIVASRV